MTKVEPRTVVNDDRYRQAELLLVRRVSSSLNHLGQQLEIVRRSHDVTWKTLLDEQRQLQDTIESGTEQPSIWSYWEDTAHPRSAPLFEAATKAIDAEFGLLTDAVSRFSSTARRLGSVPDNVLRESVSRSLMSVNTAAMSSKEINDIGHRWQKRLRRAAMRRAAIGILTSETSRTDQLVTIAELDLLDSAPWAHMDRLLMAFEFTHSDVRTHLQVCVDDLIERCCELGDDSVIVRALSRKLQTSF